MLYAKLINGSLKYAKYYIKKNDKVILNPQEQDYINAGYLPVKYEQMPLIQEGMRIVENITCEDEQIKISYTLVEEESYEESQEENLN